MSSESIVHVLILGGALGTGLMAGVYFAFSTFAMHAFTQLDDLAAADVMNSINKVIQRSWFMPLFFGTTLLYAGLAALALLGDNIIGRSVLLAAGLIYVIGMFLTTLFFNVPLNNRLSQASTDQHVVRKQWQVYAIVWTRWNHLRTFCSILTTFLSVLYLFFYA